MRMAKRASFRCCMGLERKSENRFFGVQGKSLGKFALPEVFEVSGLLCLIEKGKGGLMLPAVIGCVIIREGYGQMRSKEFGLVSASPMVSGREIFNFDSPNGLEAGVVHMGCLLRLLLSPSVAYGQRLFQRSLTY